MKGTFVRSRDSVRYRKGVAATRFHLGVGTLAQLLDGFHTRQATDLRDNVFALLGMCSDDLGRMGLMPDYSLSQNKLLPRVSAFLFRVPRPPVVTDSDAQRFAVI